MLPVEDRNTGEHIGRAVKEQDHVKLVQVLDQLGSLVSSLLFFITMK